MGCGLSLPAAVPQMRLAPSDKGKQKGWWHGAFRHEMASSFSQAQVWLGGLL